MCKFIRIVSSLAHHISIRAVSSQDFMEPDRQRDMCHDNAILNDPILFVIYMEHLLFKLCYVK